MKCVDCRCLFSSSATGGSKTLRRFISSYRRLSSEMHETTSRCPTMHLAVASSEAINGISPPSTEFQIGNLPPRQGHAIHVSTDDKASIPFPHFTANDEEHSKDSRPPKHFQERAKILSATTAYGLKHDEFSANVYLASIRRPARDMAAEFRNCVEHLNLEESKSHEDEYSLEIDCITTRAEEKSTIVPSRRVPSISLRPRLKAYTDRNLDDLLLPTHF